jgi:hypothetical protein
MVKFSTIKKLVEKDKTIKKFYTPVRGAKNTEAVFTVQEDGTFLLSLYFMFHRKHFCVALVQRFPLPRPYHIETTFVCIFFPCNTTIEGNCVAYMIYKVLSTVSSEMVLAESGIYS